MSPLPARGLLRVIPAGWSAHHRPSAYGFLTGLCRADAPGSVPDWLPGQQPPPPEQAPLWSDMPCSVQILTQSAQPVRVADSVTVEATHRISVPIASTWLHYQDTITVLDNDDDPDLIGAAFIVLKGESGTTNWTRDYLVTSSGQEAVAA